MKKEYYRISFNNINKKIPKNYDNIIIPKIEKICKYVMGDSIKLTIYNNIIYHYNKGNKEGVLSNISITNTKEKGFKTIYYKILENDIILKLADV